MNTYPDNAPFYFSAALNGQLPGLAAAAAAGTTIWSLVTTNAQGVAVAVADMVSGFKVSTDGTALEVIPVPGSAGTVQATFSFDGVTASDTVALALPIATSATMTDSASPPPGVTFP